MDLSIAIDENRWNLAIQLIGLGFDVNKKNRNGQTPLHQIAANYNEQVFTALIEYGADINMWRRDNHKTALHIAIFAKRKDCVEALLDARADVTLTDVNRNTPLHLLAANIDDAELALRLIEMGANVNEKNKHGDTPLHLACETHNVTAAKVLVDNGADVNITNGTLNDPLCVALYQKHINSKIISLLLVSRAKLNERHRANNPLHLACGKSFNLVTELISRKADVTLPSIGGRTPLHYAAFETPDIRIIKALLAAGADPSARDGNGCIPLHYACLIGANEAICLLIQANSTPNQSASDCLLALLQQKSNLASKDAVRLLLDNGADPDYFKYAYWNKHYEAITAMITYGACYNSSILIDDIPDETTKKALVFNFHQYPRLYEFTLNDFGLLNPENRQRIFAIMLLTKCSILEALPLEILTIIFGLM